MTSTDELKELAAQLRQPHGARGIDVAEMMNEANISMTHHSIKHLNLADKHHILELGHGNCGHLAYLLKQKSGLVYSGLEMSELMHRQAQTINRAFVEAKQASFHLYEGHQIPFPGNSFDRIFTVNTIYFWSEPAALLLDLYRVCKPGGRLNITFGQKDFMQTLPFTQFGFVLYNEDKIKQLVGSTPFKITGTDTQTETIKTKVPGATEFIERKFTTVCLEK